MAASKYTITTSECIQRGLFYAVKAMPFTFSMIKARRYDTSRNNANGLVQLIAGSSGVSMNTDLTFHRSVTRPAGRRAGRVPSLPMRSIHRPASQRYLTRDVRQEIYASFTDSVLSGCDHLCFYRCYLLVNVL